ncbi:YhcN/YlaJ family sporulation lipoprotein [Effusibacillus lacus]|uniref:YhcN/YlaJ family sporulation lipoprotein n=2 Tax=Effusibacillus lacus TaxID=1348429 RepID=UPI001053DDF9|nr:YhcN/YlaJ family sporulation lipoprotein [Effusibacillus lacus]TCS74916.1 hypothetical protein EDD64_11040 [Effusibacillus lacus]
MMKRSLVISSILCVALPLNGCLPAANPNRMGDTQGARIFDNNQRQGDYASRPDIAERVMSQVAGVSSAVVLVRNNTAYVAVNEGTQRRHAKDFNREGGVDFNMRGAATGDGIGNPTTSGTRSGGWAGSAGGGTTAGGTNGSQSGVGRNAQGLSELSTDMQKRIEQVVKQADPSITAVYASNSPILMTRFTTFNDNRPAARTRAGINDLGDVIRRVFPTTR